MKGCLKYTFTNVKDSLANGGVSYSENEEYVLSVPWKIIIRKKKGVSWLGVFAHCNLNHLQDEYDWSCNAMVEYSLLATQGEDIAIMKKKLPTTINFTSKAPNWGYPHFIKWSELIDPGNKYISKEGGVTFQIDIAATRYDAIRL